MGKVGIPTHAAVAVATASTSVLAQNDKATYRLLVNDSDTKVYLKFGATAVASEGVPLIANGGSFEMSEEAGNLFSGAIFGIHAGSGTKTVLVTEA